MGLFSKIRKRLGKVEKTSVAGAAVLVGTALANPNETEALIELGLNAASKGDAVAIGAAVLGAGLILFRERKPKPGDDPG